MTAYGNDGHHGRGRTTSRHSGNGGGHHHGHGKPSTTTTTSSSTTTTTTVSTTTEPATTTSSTTMPPETEPTTTSSSTTTPVTSTTSTTLAGPAEICGNCIDDDNGLVDGADPACCSASAALQLTKAKVRGKKGNLAHAKLRLRTKLAGVFTSADPTTEPVSVQLAGDDGTVVCTTLAPWTRKGRRFRYEGAATGLTKGMFRVSRAGVTFKVKGKEMDLHALPGSEVRATLRIGARCATGRAPLRQTPRALFAP